MKPLRVVFAGTPDFACPSLSALAESGCEIALVITQPDRPSGRGQQLRAPAVKQRAEALGLPVSQPERLDTPEMRAHLETLAPEAVVVVAFGQLIPSWLLQLPRLGCLNVHASLLPRYRGAAPIQRALQHGDAETGVTIMLLDEGWDTGPTLAQQTVVIGADEDAGSLHDRLAEAGALLLTQTLPAYAGGDLKPAAQDDSRATRAPKLKPEEMRLSWREPAAALHNLIRALAPAPLAETYHGERRLLVGKAQIRQHPEGASPGTVLAVRQDGVLVKAGRDALLLLEIKPAGGRLMPAAAYARGHQLLPGAQLA